MVSRQDVEITKCHTNMRTKEMTLKRAERESKNKISSTVNCFFLLYQRALYRVLVEVFSVSSWFCPFGVDSLPRSVHCAPDEIDRPFERTELFKITSVYVPVYISELTRT